MPVLLLTPIFLLLTPKHFVLLTSASPGIDDVARSTRTNEWVPRASKECMHLSKCTVTLHRRRQRSLCREPSLFAARYTAHSEGAKVTAMDTRVGIVTDRLRRVTLWEQWLGEAAAARKQRCGCQELAPFPNLTFPTSSWDTANLILIKVTSQQLYSPSSCEE